MPTKATGAGGAVTVSGAIAFLIVALWWPTADAATTVAITTVVNALLAFLGAYLPKFEGDSK